MQINFGDLQFFLGIDNLAPWLLCRQLLHLHTIWGSCSNSTSEQTTHICKHLRQPEFPQFSGLWCVHSFFLTALTCLSTWLLWARTMTHWTLSILPYITFPCFSPFFCDSKGESNPETHSTVHDSVLWNKPLTEASDSGFVYGFSEVVLIGNVRWQRGKCRRCAVSAHHKQHWSSLLETVGRVRFKLPATLWPLSEKTIYLVKSCGFWDWMIDDWCLNE